jgi:glucose-6-phosphate 1-dehydrogenase
MVSRVIPVDPFDLVIFGGTGDLARRKILPGLYRRFLAGQMTGDSRIIGAARGDLTEDDFRDLVRRGDSGIRARRLSGQGESWPNSCGCTTSRSTRKGEAAGRS